MIATLYCVHASHYLWLFNADLCNSKYHLEINFENLPPKVNKQDKDLWTQYMNRDSKLYASLMYQYISFPSWLAGLGQKLCVALTKKPIN